MEQFFKFKNLAGLLPRGSILKMWGKDCDERLFVRERNREVRRFPNAVNLFLFCSICHYYDELYPTLVSVLLILPQNKDINGGRKKLNTIFIQLYSYILVTKKEKSLDDNFYV